MKTRKKLYAPPRIEAMTLIAYEFFFEVKNFEIDIFGLRINDANNLRLKCNIKHNNRKYTERLRFLCSDFYEFTEDLIKRVLYQ